MIATIVVTLKTIIELAVGGLILLFLTSLAIVNMIGSNK